MCLKLFLEWGIPFLPLIIKLDHLTNTSLASVCTHDLTCPKSNTIRATVTSNHLYINYVGHNNGIMTTIPTPSYILVIRD